jgi:hypothetical protein
VQGGETIHWLHGNGAACGAPAGASVCPYPDTVTCRECVIVLKMDVLKRRLEAHRFATAVGRVPRQKRSQE